MLWSGCASVPRQTLLGMLNAGPELVSERPGQTLIADLLTSR